MYERILVPLDGSPVAEQVLPHAEGIAKQFGSQITLLRTITPLEKLALQTAGGGALSMPDAPVAIAQDILEAEREEAMAYLQTMKEQLQAMGIAVDTLLLEQDSATGITETAESKDVSLIAMCTHGRGGLGRLIFGSVTDEVLRKEPHIPMLLIRGEG